MAFGHHGNRIRDFSSPRRLRSRMEIIMKDTEKMRGTVKWFDARRGFGFLADEDGADYFVHFSQIQMDGFKKLQAGQEIEFELSEDDQGRTIAVEVVPL